LLEILLNAAASFAANAQRLRRPQAALIVGRRPTPILAQPVRGALGGRRAEFEELGGWYRSGGLQT
jgi:hypothetical protein